MITIETVSLSDSLEHTDRLDLNTHNPESAGFYITYKDAPEVMFPPPKYFSNDSEYLNKNIEKFLHPPREATHLVVLNNPYIHSSSAILTRSFQFIRDMHIVNADCYFRSDKEHFSIRREVNEFGKSSNIISFKKETYTVAIEGTYNYMDMRNIYNYFHWLCDVVGGFWCYNAYPELHDYAIIAPKINRSFHYYCIERAGFDASRLLSLGGIHLSTVDRLIYSRPIGGYRSQVHPDKAEFFRDFFGVPQHPVRHNSAVLIVRLKNSVGRRTLNQPEIIEAVSRALSGWNLHVVDTEDLTFEDQIDLFKKSNLVIGIHGAGLANMLFMPPGSAVIELTKLDWLPVYYELASSCGHHYATVVTDREVYHDRPDPDSYEVWPDELSFPTDKVEEAIGYLIRRMKM